MKKLIDKKIIIVSTILLGLGLISGIIFFFLTSSLDKMIIKNEILEYISMNTKTVTLSSFINSLKYNLFYIVLITCSSILYLFSPLVLFINYYKGLLIGFLVSSIFLTYKLKGILYTMVMLFPHHIIMILLVIVYSSIMFNISLKLIKGTIYKESINLNLFIKKIIILFIIAFIICIVSSLLEIYLNSYLVNLIMSITLENVSNFFKH